jgi:hypothetical protein
MTAVVAKAYVAMSSLLIAYGSPKEPEAPGGGPPSIAGGFHLLEVLKAKKDGPSRLQRLKVDLGPLQCPANGSGTHGPITSSRKAIGPSSRNAQQLRTRLN